MSEAGGRPQGPGRVLLAVVPLAWILLFIAGMQLAPDGPPDTTRFFLRSLGAARPGAPAWTALTAPWLHGDLVHLGSNLLGWALLAPLVPAALPLLGLGALAGAAAALLAGPATMGPSGGIFALAGALVRRGPDRRARLLGLAWLGLGVLGGVLDPTVDQRAHLLGAVLGLALAPRLAADSFRRTLGLAGLLGVGLVLASGPAATLVTRALAPELAALARARAVLAAWVDWQAARHQAIEDYLEAGADPAGLCTMLEPPAALRAARQEAMAALGGLPRGLGVSAALAFGGLEPARSLPGWTPTLEESSRAGWKALWAAIDAEHAALGAAGAATGALAMRIYAAAD